VQAWWPDANPHAPTWRKWIAMARENDPDAANIADASALMFREELHAIEAVIAGQGIGLFSDVLVERELVAGELVRVLDFALPGLGFYLAQIPGRPPQASIEAFSSWIRSATMQSPN
jgi:LysR family glycine cleavage system transcriptional activator